MAVAKTFPSEVSAITESPPPTLHPHNHIIIRKLLNLLSLAGRMVCKIARFTSRDPFASRIVRFNSNSGTGRQGAHRVTTQFPPAMLLHPPHNTSSGRGDMREQGVEGV